MSTASRTGFCPISPTELIVLWHFWSSHFKATGSSGCVRAGGYITSIVRVIFPSPQPTLQAELSLSTMAGNYTMSNVFVGDSEGQERDSFMLLAIYNFLQIFGFVSLAIVVLTAWLSHTVHRTAAWYSFMGSWMYFCLCYFLIAGQQVGAEPSFGVCMTQAALIYSAPPLTSCVSLAFLLQLYTTVATVLKNGQMSRTWTMVLHLFPFAVPFIIFWEALIIGLFHPHDVVRDSSGMFCSFTKITFQVKLTAAIVLLAMIAMLVFEALTLVLLLRNWTAFQRLRIHPNNAVSLPLIIRVSVFSFLPMVAMVMSSLSLLPNSPVADAKSNLVVAFLPSAAAVIFGTQRDILKAWMFWKKNPEVVPLAEHKARNVRSKADDSPV
ncbi:hypothetical protein B0H11DRAFT_1056457 [Mycena galericulata]|nr:hypothetical protein B0H11DRAFT_1056457 [Mycena galericulata]